MEFEWDIAKAAANLKKHKVSFAEAATVFGDSYGITVRDPDHSEDEDRFLTVGMSDRARLLIVAYTERGDRLRIISARQLTKTERTAYENASSA